MKLVGRTKELEQLEIIRKLDKSSLVVVSGRRRIGKSRLVQEFSGRYNRFYEFQGLAPRPDINNRSQLQNFARQCQIQFGGAPPLLDDWLTAFDHLYQQLDTRRSSLIFLDELSWMGRSDPDFVGKLKIAWDTKFSRAKQLMLVLCGSVSSWIEENILQETDFVGRISLVIRLGELPLKDAVTFWGDSSHRLSLAERLSYVNVAGGIPKYLEEYLPKQSTVANVKRLCFHSGGYLFEDFEKIFNDIFGRRSEIYKSIIQSCLSAHRTPMELTEELGIKFGGDFSEYLRDLELSGFIRRDYYYKPGGKRGKLSKIRISDNYLRFYLRYIDPNKKRIEQGLFNFNKLNDLIAWETISGLQFESLILNRIGEIIEPLGLSDERILSASPYFQRQTTRHQAVQIDLLLECSRNNFYIVEIKHKQHIGMSVISEMEEKIRRIVLPKHSSVRPVLIYMGELDTKVRDSDYFDRVLSVEAMLEEGE